MVLLVDGNNVLHVEGVLPSEVAGGGAVELAGLISRSRYRHDEAVIVLDGPGDAALDLPGRVRIIHSGRHRTADEVIVDLVERSSTPRSIVVASSDREILRRARRRRCRVLTAEEFLAQVGRDAVADRRRASARPTPPAGSTERWIREFGVPPEWLELPAAGTAPPSPEASSSQASSPEASSPLPAPPASAPPRDEAPTRGPEPPRHHPRRALEGVRRLDEVDPRELERFDMGEWIDRPPPSSA